MSERERKELGNGKGEETNGEAKREGMKGKKRRSKEYGKVS